MIYLAGPLFTTPERQWNLDLYNELHERGFDAFFPQVDCSGDNNHIFLDCVDGVDKCDTVLANVDGTDPDSGTCFEVGYAYARGKKIILYRTDFRQKSDDGSVNLMLSKSCDLLLHITHVKELVDKVAKLITCEV